MKPTKFISWRGLNIPKITHGARVDFIGPRIPPFVQSESKAEGRTIAIPKQKAGFMQVVLAKGIYEAFPIDVTAPITLVRFEPVLMVAHTPPPGLENFSAGAPFSNPMPNCPCFGDTKLPPQCGDFTIPQQYIDELPEDPPPAFDTEWPSPPDIPDLGEYHPDADDPDYC